MNKGHTSKLPKPEVHIILQKNHSNNNKCDTGADQAFFFFFFLEFEC